MSNRAATPGRIVDQVPIYRKRMTAFGEVEEPTGQFKEVRGNAPAPKHDRIHSPREKELRKLLKPKAGSKKDTLGPLQRQAMKQELWKIMNPDLQPVL